MNAKTHHVLEELKIKKASPGAFQAKLFPAGHGWSGSDVKAEKKNKTKERQVKFYRFLFEVHFVVLKSKTSTVVSRGRAKSSVIPDGEQDGPSARIIFDASGSATFIHRRFPKKTNEKEKKKKDQPTRWRTFAVYSRCW